MESRPDWLKQPKVYCYYHHCYYWRLLSIRALEKCLEKIFSTDKLRISANLHDQSRDLKVIHAVKYEVWVNA